MKIFPWGEVKKIHKIEGLPDIIEYVVAPDFYEADETGYHIEGSDVSFESLHQAIVASLCVKYDTMECAPYVCMAATQTGDIDGPNIRLLI